LGAEIRVESSVGMLRLGLSEDGLDHDLLFFSVECEFSLLLLLLEPLLVKTLPVPEKQHAKFALLLFLVVRRNLVEPQAHQLDIVLLLVRNHHVILSVLH